MYGLNPWGGMDWLAGMQAPAPTQQPAAQTAAPSQPYSNDQISQMLTGLINDRMHPQSQGIFGNNFLPKALLAGVAGYAGSLPGPGWGAIKGISSAAYGGLKDKGDTSDENFKRKVQALELMQQANKLNAPSYQDVKVPGYGDLTLEHDPRTNTNRVPNYGVDPSSLPPMPTDDIKEYQYYVNQAKTQGQTPVPFNEWQLQNKRAGAQSVVIGAENAWSKGMAEQGVKQIEAFSEANKASRKTLKNLDVAETLANSPGVYQGPAGEQVARVKRIGEALGYSIEGTDASTAFQSLSNQMALQFRNPENGAGMPGALSDADRDFLKATVPGLSQGKSGNLLMIDIARRLENRNIAERSEMSRFISKNKSIEGLEEHMAEWGAKQPDLFTDLAKKSSPQQGPQPGTVEDGYEFIGGDPSDSKNWRKK